MADVIVIGGGVIGLSVAYELAGQGIAVRVVDQGALGREASWAGAGMLPPGNCRFSLSPEERLRALSHSLWKQLTEELQSTTGIDNGYRLSGSIELRLSGSSDQLDAEQTCWRDEGVEVAETTIADLRQREPALSPKAVAGYRLPELGQVRNPRHLKALLAGCAARGVQFSPGTPVMGFDRHAEKIVGIKTPLGTLKAGTFCLCTGAWSAGLAETKNLFLPIKPVRGQIVLLNAQPLPFRSIVQSGSRYLVPRPDGRVLIGSTEEDVGFEKRNTAVEVSSLIQFATQLVPALANATLEQCWSGLRPGSPEGLPYLGRVPDTENLYLAAGHFRSGLQMSPGTAVILRDLILSREPRIPLDGLTCDRHRQQEIPTNV
ncbi:MAG: glycine oxidase ThiO [Planctomycetaceae bacterium]|nr:glycine oxidase ThiO [Planctomycetaceae bacterium]